jgi:hypothetical protein
MAQADADENGSSQRLASTEKRSWLSCASGTRCWSRLDGGRLTGPRSAVVTVASSYLSRGHDEASYRSAGERSAAS